LILNGYFSASIEDAALLNGKRYRRLGRTKLKKRAESQPSGARFVMAPFFCNEAQ
jgi:hypothetical protein